MEALQVDLERKCYELGLLYVTGAQLMTTGLCSPPDLKLRTPFIYKGSEIHWIDTDVMFGDIATHRDNLSCRFDRFIRGFGPGLCVYWQGYDEQIDNTSGIVITDDVLGIQPTDIRVLTEADDFINRIQPIPQYLTYTLF